MCFSLPKTSSNELLHLDALRFFASAGIMYRHSHEFFYEKSIRTSATATTQGLALFVDLFFLISGFVIAHMYYDHVGNIRDYKSFMARRIFRLVPLHWLTLILSMIVWTILLSFAPASNGPTFNPACIVATALLLNGIVDCGNVYNGQSWSVSAEMVMYASFPIMVALTSRNKLVPFAIATAMLAALLVITQGPLNAMRWDQVHPVARAIVSFSVGVGLWANKDKIAIPFDQVLLWLAFATLVFCMLTGASMLIDLALIYAVGVFAASSEKRKSAPIVGFPARMGHLTYGMYMWHGMIIVILMNALGDKILHLHGITAVVLGVASYALIIALSIFSFHYIERPTNMYLRNIFKNRKKPVVRM